jgi:quercetin dioxygenase-like cupin family protein
MFREVFTMSEKKPKYAIISKTPNYTPPRDESAQFGEKPHHKDPTEGAMQGLVFMEPELVPGVTMNTGIALLTGKPGEFIEEHTHNSDELVFFVSTRPDHSLGCKAEIYLDGEKHTFTHTTVVYVPKGTKHCPIHYKDWEPGAVNYLMHVLAQPEYD